MKSDSEIATLFDKQRKEAARGLSSQQDNTIMCQSYYNDTNSSYQDSIQFADTNLRRRRAMVNFQKIGSNVDAVVGFMAQNRRQAKYIARINSQERQQLYSRNMNALHSFHRENANADQLESKQDLELLVNGYGMIDTDLSYIVGNATTLAGGEVLKCNIDSMRGYWDSKARAPNVMDRRFCGYYDDYNLKDALSLFQNSKPDDFEDVADTGFEDKAGYVFNPWGGLYDKIKLDNSAEWSAKEEDMVRVYNHQWFEYETYYRAKNPLYEVTDPMDALYMKARLDVIKNELKSYAPAGINAGDLFDFDPLAEELTFDEATKSKLVKEFGALITPVGFKRKCFYTAVISGKHIFAKFKNVCQQGFSINIKTGQYNERGKIWIGMVNAMIEPAKYYNKALTELMFIIASNSKGGVLVEEGAVEDIADFETKYAKTDAVIEVLSGSISGQKIQDKARPALPTGLEGILQLSEQSISQNGVDPAFLGEANAQETGILYKRRIRQIISKMWWVADAITLYQKEDARLCADLYRVWVENNTGILMRIVGEDGVNEFITISQDMLAPEYDVTIQEGAQTPEDKQEVSGMLSSMGDKYLAVGDNAKASALYSEAVQGMPLDGDVKNRISATLTGDGQSVPMAQYQALQQQLQQLQSQLNQAQVENLQSMTALNQSKIAESHATVRNKAADTIKKVEESKHTNMETNIIRQHASTANVTV